MDGLQRLSAIYEFYTDAYRLEGLQQWAELNGRTYSELPQQVKKGIDRRYLSSIILLQETAKNENDAKKLKQLVFERINSGGVFLKPQESRNAVYNGPLNQVCLDLSRYEPFCLMWGIPIGDENDEDIMLELLLNVHFKEMEDVELVLRFFANRQRSRYASISNKRFSDYLDLYLKHGNNFPRETLSSLSDLFKQTVDLVYTLFGEKAFWLLRKRANSWNWRSSPTTAVYDPLMMVAANYLKYKNHPNFQNLIDEERIKYFYIKNYSIFEGRNTNTNVLLEREECFNFLFNSLLDD